jgi:8-oxo-dGTP pyrophosphatase MutT (NUDIX family)
MDSKNKINIIRDIFMNREPKPIGTYKRSAVLILLCVENYNLNIIFEVRALNLQHQPGDICLPGGKIENSELPLETALRETYEELGIDASNIEIIGSMDYFVSPYNAIMYPFIGLLKSNEIKTSKDEVDHIFKVPVDFFVKNNPILHEMVIKPELNEDFPFDLIRDGKNYKFANGVLKEYFYKYNEYTIWGFTAQIIKSFIDILNGSNYFNNMV